MRPEEARAVLGLARDATPEQARRAWRRLVRTTHPDVAGGDRAAGAAAATAELNAAYAVLRTGPTAAAAPPPAPPTPPPRAVRGGSLWVEAPRGEAFLVLLEAAGRVGDVTYVDVESGLLEVLVRLPVGPCSVLVDLQGRGDGTTEAWCTVECLSDPSWRASADVLRTLLDDVAAAAEAPPQGWNPGHPG